MQRRPALTLLAAAVAALALLLAPSAHAAKTSVAVGMGDQNPAMFTNANYQSLGIKKVRYFIRWDAMKFPAVRKDAERYVAAARKAGDRVFMHISTNDFTPKKAKLISVATFRKDVGRLVRHFRKRGVKEWGVWNEANHRSQPTYRSPKRAAEYYVAMRSLCKGCTIVALDALDQAGDARYIARFFNALPRSVRTAKVIVGIHNYSDTNRRRATGTARIIKAVKAKSRKASFWLTETGGVANFGSAFPCDLQRQANRTTYMFSLAKKYRRDIDRIYAYSWTGANCQGFDAGLTEADGATVRPAYDAFKKAARNFTR